MKDKKPPDDIPYDDWINTLEGRAYILNEAFLKLIKVSGFYTLCDKICNYINRIKNRIKKHIK